MAFYQNTSDTNLKKDLILKSGDIYIMKHERENTATLDLTTATAAVITDSNASFTVDGLISTVGLNLYIIDDNSKLAVGKVDDNDATTITFDSTAMVLVEDGSTAPSFTDTNTYSYRVQSPSSSNIYGDFLGYVNEITFNNEPEIAEFKYNIPRQKIREDLLENVTSITGSIANLSNSDVFSSIFGMTEYGSQTSQSEYHAGSNSFNTDFYEITILAQDVNDRNWIINAFSVKIKNDGELALSSDEYKAVNAMMPLFDDALRDSTSVNRWRWIRAD